MNDSRLDAVPRPGISTFPIKHQILTIRLSLQSIFRFCRQIYTQPTHNLRAALERHRWPGLSAVGKVVAERCPKDGKASVETRYYLTSAPLPAERFARAVRSHWAIENSLHWVLDVTMNEDGQRNRKDHGSSNLALLRRLSLNIARVQPDKDSMRGKLKRAGWNTDFLLDMVRATLQLE